MRQLISLMAVYSGLAISISMLVPSQAAIATENKAETQIAAAVLEQKNLPTNQTKVVCSRNHPLSVNAEGVKIASGIAPQSSDWAAPNIIKLFCRDVRINTIVVRDYCALIRQ
jgi:hypothetical protein